MRAEHVGPPHATSIKRWTMRRALPAFSLCNERPFRSTAFMTDNVTAKLHNLFDKIGLHRWEPWKVVAVGFVAGGVTMGIFVGILTYTLWR